MKRLFSIGEAANFMGVCTDTVEAYIDAGYLTPVPLPPARGKANRIRRVLLDLRDLDIMIDRWKWPMGSIYLRGKTYWEPSAM